jgi:hypothetical protein
MTSQPIDNVNSMLDKVFRKANEGSLSINAGVKLISNIEKRISKIGD